MSMYHCEFCDRLIDTDFHDICPSCDHDPFGEPCDDPDCDRCKEVDDNEDKK